MGHSAILLWLFFCTGLISNLRQYRIRRSLNDLTRRQRTRLKRALYEAKQPGTYYGPSIAANFTSAYDAAASFHGYPGLCAGPGHYGEGGGCCIHSYSTFLPWHRLLVLQLEDALRSTKKKYKDIALPYWDWTQKFK